MGDGVDCGEDCPADLLDSETVSELLSNQRRRYALYALYTSTNPMTLPDLAQQVTEWEYDRPAEEILDTRLRVYMSLYHDHVPKLADADLVIYYQEDDVIELTKTAASLAASIERLIRTDVPRSRRSPERCGEHREETTTSRTRRPELDGGNGDCARD